MQPTETKTRTYQVTLATVEVEGLFELDNEVLEDSWIPGVRASRYGREWRLSRPEIQEDHWIGRIGFVKPGEITTLEWDDEAADFVEGDASGGVVVPFVIDISSDVVAYQLRGNLVRPNTFTGALEALLNEGSTYTWVVSPLVIPRSFQAWKADIARVISFRFRLEVPNPNWQGRELVEEIVEGVDADVVTLSAQGDDLDTDSDIFRQALDHALQDYGRATVRGIDTNGLESTWRTIKEMGGVVTPKTQVEAESNEVEVPTDTLSEALSSMQHRMNTETDGDFPADSDDDSQDVHGAN